MPYAFCRTISDVLCSFKLFHNFIFHQSERLVYLGPGVTVGSLLWSARNESYAMGRCFWHKGQVWGGGGVSLAFHLNFIL